MLRIIDAISSFLLMVTLGATGIALYGPNRLPDRIPTHLNDLGQPDAWTSRGALQILLVVAVVVYLALAVVAAYSSLAKRAAQESPESGPPFEAQTLKLIVGIKAELMGIFACVQLSTLHTARHPDNPASIWGIGMWVLLAGVFVTVAWYVTKMIQMDRAQEARSGSSEPSHTS
jgi:uncharacterized membrane protein